MAELSPRRIKRSFTPGNEPAPGTLIEGALAVNVPDRKVWIGNASDDPVLLVDWSDVAVTEHSDTATYAFDDLVGFEGTIYHCIVAHSAEPFNLTNWSPIAGSGGGGIVFDYRWTTGTAGVVAAGGFGVDTADPALATQARVSSETSNGNPVSLFWNSIRNGDYFGFIEGTGGAEYAYFIATGAAVLIPGSPDYYEIPCSPAAVDGNPENNRIGIVTIIGDPNERFPDGGDTGEALFKNSGADYDASWRLPVETDISDLDRVRPRGTWVQQLYERNDMVLDAPYMAVANVQTSDRPAPQKIGDPAFVYQGLSPTGPIVAKSLTVASNYTFPYAMFLSKYRVYTVTGNTYRTFYINDGVVTELLSFTATEIGWREFNTNEVLAGVGAELTIGVTVTEPDPTPTTFTLSYNYLTPNNPATPTAGTINHSNQLPSSFRVHKTDQNGDQSANLATMTVGDIIEGGGTRWSIQAITDNGTWIDFSVAPASQITPDGVQDFIFETVVATPITTINDPGYWLANPDVTGSYIIDNGATVVTDDAYGIDIEVQEASISPDWDIYSVSGSGTAAGEGTGGVTEYKDLTDTPINYVGAAGLRPVVNPGETGLDHTQVDYSELDNIPTSFPPDPHSHVTEYKDLTDTPIDYVGAAGLRPVVNPGETGLDHTQVDYSELDNIPTSFPPDPHSHDTNDITFPLAAPGDHIASGNIPDYSFAGFPEEGLYRTAAYVGVNAMGTSWNTLWYADHTNFWLDTGLALELYADRLNLASTIQVRAGNGSAAAPTYSFRDHLDTGLYSDGPLRFAHDGLERLRIEASHTVFTTGAAGDFRVTDPVLASQNEVIYYDQSLARVYLGSNDGVDVQVRGLNLRLPSGTLAEPALRFAADLDTGLYLHNSTRMSLVRGGVAHLTIRGGGYIYANNQSASGATTVYYGGVDGDVGGTTRFSHRTNAGSAYLTTQAASSTGTSAYIYVRGNAHASLPGSVQVNSGDTPGAQVNIANSDTTGAGFIRLRNQAMDLYLYPDRATIDQPFQFDAGAVGTPGITFTADTDTGFYQSTPGQIDVAVDGVLSGTIYPTGPVVPDDQTLLTKEKADTLYDMSGGISWPLFSPAGSAAEPSYSFTAEAGTGMYQAAVGMLEFSVGGVLAGRIDPPGTTVSSSQTLLTKEKADAIYDAGGGLVFPLLAPSGDGTAPSYSFADNSANGMFHVNGADENGNGLVLKSNGHVQIQDSTAPSPIVWSRNSNEVLAISRNGDAYMDITSATGAIGQLSFSDADAWQRGHIRYTHVDELMTFTTSGTNRLTLGENGGARSHGPMQISGSLVDTLGVTPPELVISNSVPGRTWEPNAATELLIERNGDVNLSLVSGNASTAAINFGNDLEESNARILYNHNTDNYDLIHSGVDRLRITPAITVLDVPSLDFAVADTNLGQQYVIFYDASGAKVYLGSTDGVAVQIRGPRIQLDVEGTRTNPAITWTNHLDTGFFLDLAGNNRVVVAHDGERAATFDPAGSSATYTTTVITRDKGDARYTFVVANRADLTTNIEGARVYCIEDGVTFLYQFGATTIPDLPGWLPHGDVTPNHYGITANGFGAALMAAIANHTDIRILPGNYTLTDVIQMRSGVTVRCDAGVFIDANSAPALEPIIAFHGDLDPTLRFPTGTTNRGDQLITTSVAHGYAVGDLLHMLSQRNSLSEDAGVWRLGFPQNVDQEVYFAEFLEVDDVPSTTTFHAGSPVIYPGYRDNVSQDPNTTRTRTDLSRVLALTDAHWIGGTITRDIQQPNYREAFEMMWAKDCTVEGATVRRGLEPGRFIRIFCSLRCEVIGGRCIADPDPTWDVDEDHSGRNMFYTVGAQDCGFTRCYSEYGGQVVDHTFAGVGVANPGGGNDAANFANTRPFVIGCTFVNTYQAATSHPGVYREVWRDNRFPGSYRGGILCRGLEPVISGNEIEGHWLIGDTNENFQDGRGITLQYGQARRARVFGNRIKGLGAGFNVRGGTNLGEWLDCNISITENSVEECRVGLLVDHQQPDANVLRRVVYRDNAHHRLVAWMVQMSTHAGGYTIADNYVYGSFITQAGDTDVGLVLAGNACPGLTVTGNVWQREKGTNSGVNKHLTNVGGASFYPAVDFAGTSIVADNYIWYALEDGVQGPTFAAGSYNQVKYGTNNQLHDIAAGVITVPPHHTNTTALQVDTEGGAATDNLDRLLPAEGCVFDRGHTVHIQTQTGARDVTIRDVTQSGVPDHGFQFEDGLDFELTTSGAALVASWAGLHWIVIGKANLAP